MASRIKRPDIYLKRLQNTFIDKAFFVEKLPKEINTIIDFGCADGSFCEFLANIYHTKFKYFGIERNKNFIKKCLSKGLVTWTHIDDIPADTLPYCVVNFSSSLHEMFNYYDPKYVYDIMNRLVSVKRVGAIAIRDMGFVLDSEQLHIDESEEMLTKLYSALMDFCPEQLEDFEIKTGRITTIRQCIHLMLKYMYKSNWNREVQENYLDVRNAPYTWDTLLKSYERVWCQRYNLPYLIRKWKNDLCLDNQTIRNIRAFITTHYQALYVRSDLENYAPNIDLG